MHYAKTTATSIAVALAAAAGASIVAPMADTYLEADGTQAIDTGWYASDKTKVVIDFEPNETNVAQYVFGAAGNGLPLGLSLSDSSFTLQMIGHKNFNPIPKPEKIRYRAIFDCTTATASITKHLATPFEETSSYNGTTIDSVTNDISLAIFSRHTSGYSSLFSGKLYSMKIFDDGTLVRDFIPYGFGATTGLYDRVNGKVYGNVRSGGNPFVIGHGDAYVRGSTSAPVYVNTDIAPSSNVKVEIDYALMTTNAKARVFGVTASSDLVVDLHIHRDGNALRYCMHDASVDGTNMKNDEYNLVVVDPERHVFTIDGMANTVLLTSSIGTITNYAGEVASHTLSTQKPMFIFGAPGSGQLNGANPCDVKVYSMKIWDDVDGQRALLRDFTPRMENGEYGFFDNVSQQFFGRFVDANNNHLRGGGAIESDADPISAFTVNPQSGEIPVEGSVTLSATAPGAIGYQWFLDGEMLEGATGSTLVVDWTKDTRLVRTYKCIAFFNVFGYAESTEAVLTNAPAATVIIMK